MNRRLPRVSKVVTPAPGLGSSLGRCGHLLLRGHGQEHFLVHSHNSAPGPAGCRVGNGLGRCSDISPVVRCADISPVGLRKIVREGGLWVNLGPLLPLAAFTALRSRFFLSGRFAAADVLRLSLRPPA